MTLSPISIFVGNFLMATPWNMLFCQSRIEGATIDVKEQKLKIFLDTIQVDEYKYKLRE